MRLGYVSRPGRGAGDAVIAAVADHLGRAGVRLAGTVQTSTPGPGSHPCDMDLMILPRGPVFRISQTLGPGSRGCRLDADMLEDAALHAARHLDAADVLLVNKFGRLECEGRGFVPLVADALARGIPVLVGVNGLNLPAFLAFADGMAQPLPGSAHDIACWLLSDGGGYRSPATGPEAPGAAV